MPPDLVLALLALIGCGPRSAAIALTLRDQRADRR